MQSDAAERMGGAAAGDSKVWHAAVAADRVGRMSWGFQKLQHLFFCFCEPNLSCACSCLQHVLSIQLITCCGVFGHVGFVVHALWLLLLVCKTVLWLSACAWASVSKARAFWRICLSRSNAAAVCIHQLHWHECWLGYFGAYQ